LARHGLNQLALVAASVQLSLFADNSQNHQPSKPLSREESIKEAYRLQSDEVAYVEKIGNEYE
jgi:hypothetical protein